MNHPFWAHYCPCEHGVLWVADGEQCNWCGLSCDPVVAEGEAQEKAVRPRSSAIRHSARREVTTGPRGAKSPHG